MSILCKSQKTDRNLCDFVTQAHPRVLKVTNSPLRLLSTSDNVIVKCNWKILVIITLLYLFIRKRPLIKKKKLQPFYKRCSEPFPPSLRVPFKNSFFSTRTRCKIRIRTTHPMYLSLVLYLIILVFSFKKFPTFTLLLSPFPFTRIKSQSAHV